MGLGNLPWAQGIGRHLRVIGMSAAHFQEQAAACRGVENPEELGVTNFFPGPFGMCPACAPVPECVPCSEGMNLEEGEIDPLHPSCVLACGCVCLFTCHDTHWPAAIWSVTDSRKK